MTVPTVLVVSCSTTNRLGLPRVPLLPACRVVVVSGWERAVVRAATDAVRVVVTDAATFTQDRELTRASLEVIGAGRVLVVGLAAVTRWARELQVEGVDRIGYAPRLLAELAPVAV